MASQSSNLLVRGLGQLPSSWIARASQLRWKYPLAKRVLDAVATRMRNRDAVIQNGPGKGLRFNARGSRAGMILGTTEPALQRAFEIFLKPGMAVYDVGANVGFFSVIAAHLVGDSGKVFAFEPMAENVEAVAYNAGLNGFAHVVHQELALGNVDGHARFMESANPNWGRLASAGRPASVVGERDVTVRRIDSLVTDGLEQPSAIKIDVEGSEAEVLDGARDTLRTARPLLFIDLHGTSAAIAVLLDELDYDARVSRGGNTPIAEARWDAQIVAVPRERGDLRDALENVASR